MERRELEKNWTKIAQW